MYRVRYHTKDGVRFSGPFDDFDVAIAEIRGLTALYPGCRPVIEDGGSKALGVVFAACVVVVMVAFGALVYYILR